MGGTTRRKGGGAGVVPGVPLFRNMGCASRAVPSPGRMIIMMGGHHRGPILDEGRESCSEALLNKPLVILGATGVPSGRDPRRKFRARPHSPQEQAWPGASGARPGSACGSASRRRAVRIARRRLHPSCSRVLRPANCCGRSCKAARCRRPECLVASLPKQALANRHVIQPPSSGWPRGLRGCRSSRPLAGHSDGPAASPAAGCLRASPAHPSPAASGEAMPC